MSGHNTGHGGCGLAHHLDRIPSSQHVEQLLAISLWSRQREFRVPRRQNKLLLLRLPESRMHSIPLQGYLGVRRTTLSGSYGQIETLVANRAAYLPSLVENTNPSLVA